MIRRKLSLSNLARLVKTTREACQDIDLTGFPPAANLADEEVSAIKSSVVQALANCEGILGARGADCQDLLVRKGPRELAESLLFGSVLIHMTNCGLTDSREDVA